MARKSPIDVARDYGAHWGIPFRSGRLTRKHRSWWIFRVRAYEVEIDSGDGIVQCWVNGNLAIYSFDYQPKNADTWLLPLWAAFPLFSSMTIFWRMLSGEEYKHKWHAFYRSLPEEERRKYKERFPSPTDEVRGRGSDWYELVADQPASGRNPIAELIIGRV